AASIAVESSNRTVVARPHCGNRTATTSQRDLPCGTPSEAEGAGVAMSIWVDNREYPAAPDKNLLERCLELGFDLPYFCWHPAMGSVGACRQCAVKQYRDENDTQGRIVMACMTAAADGTRIGLDEPEARDFRARVIEWLMVNHPHDCPVCEEGGEC